MLMRSQTDRILRETTTSFQAEVDRLFSYSSFGVSTHEFRLLANGFMGSRLNAAIILDVLVLHLDLVRN